MATYTSIPCDGNTLRDGSTHHIKELSGRTAPLEQASREQLGVQRPSKRKLIITGIGPKGKETVQITFPPENVKDYKNEQGSETLCGLLRNMDESKDIVKSIDESPTLWQGNWMEVTWPRGPELLTKDQTRLWFKTGLRDVSGSKMDVWMTEQSALALSGLADKDQFLKTWEAGEQTFPIMASVKITRTLQKPDGVGQPDGTADRPTNLTIVHASDQPFKEAPTQATANLIHFLKDTTDDTSCILPASLHMIKESGCYNFEVVFPSGAGGPFLSLLRQTSSVFSQAMIQILLLADTRSLRHAACSIYPHFALIPYVVNLSMP